MNPYLLLLLGYVLIFLEFYLPGAIMGILGSLLVITSILVFVSQSGSLLFSLLYIVVALLGIAALVKFALWKIPRTKSSFSIYLRGDQKGYRASSFDTSAIGKVGTVLSDLKPGGYILIDGKQHQAVSVSGYIEKGTKVLVLKGQEESLIVKKKEEKS